jgi:hypothetical protein
MPHNGRTWKSPMETFFFRVSACKTGGLSGHVYYPEPWRSHPCKTVGKIVVAFKGRSHCH